MNIDHKSFSKKVLAKCKERGVLDRGDLALSDWKSLDKVSATVLLTFNEGSESPTSQEINAWVEKGFGGIASAKLDSIRVYPKHNAISVIVAQHVQTQPIGYANNMIRAGASEYMDNSNQIWNVVSSANGSYLAKQEKTTMADIVSARQPKLRATISRRNHIMLAMVVDSIPSAGGGFATADIGDLVDFYHNSMFQRGRITSGDAGEVKIKVEGGLADGKLFSVSVEAITNIRERAPKNLKKTADVIRDHQKYIYTGNPDLVKKITPLSDHSVKDDRGGLDIQPINASVKKNFDQPTITRPR